MLANPGSLDMTIVAVVATGEMGAGVAARLVERGARVLTSLDGRGEASANRAAAAGVQVTNDAGLIAEAEMFLSIVPPNVAGTTAERFLPLIEKAARKPVYVDCNAIAPQTLKTIAKMFHRQGVCRSWMPPSSAPRQGGTARARGSICPARFPAKPIR